MGAQAALASAPSLSLEAPGRDGFIAFVADEETRGCFCRTAPAAGLNADAVLTGGIGDAAELLAERGGPRVLAVDLSESADPFADLDGLAQVCDPETAVIAVGTINDVAFFRRLMALGIRDYLVKPVSDEQVSVALTGALRPVHMPLPPAGPDRDASADNRRLIAVTGVHGGVGASTGALNLAWMLAQECGKRTVLVDMDIYFGTAALALDVEPGRGFREALEAPDRIDSLFIERATVKVNEQFSVLCSEENLESPVNAAPEALSALIESLRESFECIVLELPRAGLPQWRGSLAGLTDVALFTDLSLAGLRDTIRIKRFFAAAAPDAAVQVIANKVGEPSAARIDKDQFEKGSELKLNGLVPFEKAAVGEAYAVGKALAECAPNAKATAAFRRLALGLAGTEEGAEGRKKRWLKWRAA